MNVYVNSIRLLLEGEAVSMDMLPIRWMALSPQKGTAVWTIWLKFVMTTTAYMTSGKSKKKS